jgi:hypothetical protein
MQVLEELVLRFHRLLQQVNYRFHQRKKHRRRHRHRREKGYFVEKYLFHH